MDILNDEILLNEKDLLITIWTKPKLSLEFILKYCPNKYVNALLVLGGITNAFDKKSTQFITYNSISPISLLVVLIFGGLFGWLFSYLYAVMLKWTGTWLNGKAKTDQFLTVIAWSLIPSISSLILMIPKQLLFGDGLFIINIRELLNPKDIIYLVFAIIELGLSIWTLVILIKGIALIQNFNTGKSILNAVLPLLVLIVPLMAIFGIIYLIP